jgi:hypothetical protein
MKYLIVIIFLCSGCHSLIYDAPDPHAYSKLSRSELQQKTLLPPEFNVFESIYKTPYQVGLYDCSNKAADYYRHLKSRGWIASVVTVDYDGPKATLYRHNGDKYRLVTHSIVVVQTKKGFLFCDPTNYQWHTELQHFSPNRKITRWVNHEGMKENDFE